MSRDTKLTIVTTILGIAAGCVTTVIYAKYPEIGDWLLWCCLVVCLLCFVEVCHIVFVSYRKRDIRMPEDDRPKGPVGIFIGKGARNITTDGNKFFGIANPIVDYGSDNQHKNNEVYGNGSERRDRFDPKAPPNKD